jgi:hypothetical protein
MDQLKGKDDKGRLFQDELIFTSTYIYMNLLVSVDDQVASTALSSVPPFSCNDQHGWIFSAFRSTAKSLLLPSCLYSCVDGMDRRGVDKHAV